MGEPRTFHWSRQAYYALAADGIWAGRRVQLIRGEIIEMPPQGHLHFVAIARAARLLEGIFGPAHWIRTQAPLDISDESVPEPDVAVTEHPIEHYSSHPTTALLVVEVSDSSLRLDREKAELYAAAGIQEYWIVNLVDRQLEVYRHPSPAAGDIPAAYQPPLILASSAEVALLARSEAKIQVAQLLP
ncbi:MAG: Uma2 family endonuclease [Tepidisphaeraceae bacterium]